MRFTEHVNRDIRKKLVNVVLLLVLWSIPMMLLFVLLFSVYPNYISKNHQGEIFNSLRGAADKVATLFTVNHANREKVVINNVDILDGIDCGLPAKRNHPTIITKKPGEVAETAYFKKPSNPIVYHTFMVPDPFTTFAPLAGDINGSVFHNHQQFRYPLDLKKKNKNEYRIFITGGSVAWGSCATDVESTIAGFMEKNLKVNHPNLDIKVITAAASAWSSTQERIWIFNRITEYEPDVIIQYSGVNDLFDNYLLKHDLYDRYYADGGYFRYAIGAFDFYNRGEAISRLGLDDTGSRFAPSDFPRKTLKNIKIINSYLKNTTVRYVYVLQPKGKIKGHSDYYHYYNVLKKEVGILSKMEAFQFIDHSNLFDGHEGFYADSIHPGDRGYKLIAEDLLKKIHLDIQ